MPKPNPLTQGLQQEAKSREAAKVSPRAKTERTQKTEVTKSKYPPSRQGRVLIGAHFVPEVSIALKVIAAQERSTVAALLAEGINAVFAKRHKPEIAELQPAPEADAR